ncbi:MAG: beta-agarase, partial [bacterium]
MNGYPGVGTYGSGGKVVDPAKLTALLVFASYPKADHRFTIANLRAVGDVTPLPAADRFFPFIDEFGQYVHKDWPGKLKSAEEFSARIAAEDADLGAHPAPADRDRWGGWKNGPRFKATGFFYPLKRSTRWWLVDPEGRLFWSQGVTCVGMGAAGPVEGRARWYRGLPREDEPAFKEFFWRGGARSDDRYKDKQVLYFDWGAANAKRKYGERWRETGGELAHRRLASWGLNTIGAWSSHEIFRKRRTPYTAIVHPGGPELKGSEGYWANFRDVFDPGFRTAVREGLKNQADGVAGDPWCVGIFVDNELSWGNDTDLGKWTLASPEAQPARRAFMAQLHERHPSSTVASEADLRAWTARTAEEYFTICRDEVRRFAPKQMYLGCRFAWVNDEVVR